MRCVGMTLAVLAAVWTCPAAGQTLEAEYDAAQAAFDKGNFSVAAVGFEQLLAKMSEVGSADPLRQLALLRMASLSAAAKQFDEASRLLAETGLQPDQCALVDVAPLPTNASIGSSAFPDEALDWEAKAGFA